MFIFFLALSKRFLVVLVMSNFCVLFDIFPLTKFNDGNPLFEWRSRRHLWEMALEGVGED